MRSVARFLPLEGFLGLHQQQFPCNGPIAVQMHFLLKKVPKIYEHKILNKTVEYSID